MIGAEALELLLPSAPPPPDPWQWATVTQASPLRVRLDGEPNPLPVTPESLVQGLVVGQRVWCQIRGRRVVVHGTPDTPPWLDFTPALTAATTNPTGFTATGRWGRSGRLVVMLLNISAGGGFTPGSGVYNVSLPTPARVLGVTSGAVRGYDASTGNAHLGLRCSVATATTLSMQYTTSFGGTLNNVFHGGPWTWAAGDILDGWFLYEAAA
ncbi:MAG: hypothetical protein ACO1ON_13160 [Nocardioides sp.]